MGNQHWQEDSFGPSPYRRSRDRYHHNSPYRHQDHPADENRTPYSPTWQQGRGEYLHSSHPYDYSWPPETHRHPGAGYFPPPAYPHRPGRKPSAQSRYEEDAPYDAPYFGSPGQSRWPGDRRASEQERQDYIRARDRHDYGRQRAENQDPYRPDEWDDPYRPSRPAPQYPTNSYDWDNGYQNRKQYQNRSLKPQQNRMPSRFQPRFPERPQQPFYPQPGPGNPHPHRHFNKSKTKDSNMHYPDFQGGKW